MKSISRYINVFNLRTRKNAQGALHEHSSGKKQLYGVGHRVIVHLYFRYVCIALSGGSRYLKFYIITPLIK
jgi:hypothetical protein